MPVYRDQLDREVVLDAVPRRIISLVPSQTELLYYLGLDEAIAGITKFCIHPADRVKSAPKIGGTKQLDIERIKQLNPDLIIANKEENEQSQVDELARHFPVWISDINDVPSSLQMIESVGEMTGRAEIARKLIAHINEQFDKLTQLRTTALKVLYLIWRKPFMAAGKGTFVEDMLNRCGLQNAVTADRYPELTDEDIVNANPDVVMLSSEPFPFGEKHVAEVQELLPATKVILADGEMFSWYGSRLLYMPAYFMKLLQQIEKG